MAWYRGYCYFAAGINLLLFVKWLEVYLNPVPLAEWMANQPAMLDGDGLVSMRDYFVWALQTGALALMAVNLMFIVVNAWFPHGPRNPKWHRYHMFNIILGMLSCFTAPFCIWLFLKWMTPGVKQLFGLPGTSQVQAG